MHGYIKYAFGVLMTFAVVASGAEMCAAAPQRQPAPAAQQKQAEAKTWPLTIKTQAGKTHVFKVELARKPAEYAKGLMHRKSLPKNQGMLFVFPPPARPRLFWMKDTLIPLDMLFIDENNTIVFIEHNAEPNTYFKRGPTDKLVTQVLELNGGTAKHRNIREGDRVMIDLPKE